MGIISAFLATRTRPLTIKSLAGNAIFRRSSALLGLATALMIAAPANTASAQGFFDLFGPRQAPPSQALGYASAPQTTQPASQTPRVSTPQRSVSGGQAYCVRLCDGRHFPIQHNGNASPAQLCNSLCPSAETKVFSGSEIGRSTARDGTRYSSLQNAFAYRTRIVEACTCNGKDSFGTASIDASADPTLRKGDIVATADTQVTPAASTTKR
jgi:hypothetical protein